MHIPSRPPNSKLIVERSIAREVCFRCRDRPTTTHHHPARVHNQQQARAAERVPQSACRRARAAERVPQSACRAGHEPFVNNRSTVNLITTHPNSPEFLNAGKDSTSGEQV